MKRIHESLNAMLDELKPEELNMVEDFIVNECDVDDTDENGNIPNLFRMFITYKQKPLY
jgi:hypothetical protein